MKLTRRFYNSSTNYNGISIKRLVIGIAIGLVSAFTIYSFFYVLRESFRVISFGFMNYGFQNTQNILSDSDRNFYNVFFAGLSLVLGNSISILYIFSKPDNIINRLNPKRKRILNDQIFLNFNFVYWFNKIGLAFGVFSMCCMDFEFMPYFKPMTYLLLVVLYLESWKNLSLILKKYRFKIQIIHLLIISILTIGLSRINIINYRSIDELSLKYNPIINLPNSDFYNVGFNSPDLEIVFKLKLEESSNILKIFTEDKRKIELDEVSCYVAQQKTLRREELIPFISVRIIADKSLKLKHIKMFEAELYSINMLKIVYEVYNEDLFSKSFINRGITKRIGKPVLNFKEKEKEDCQTFIYHQPRHFPIDIEKYHFKDTLKIAVNKELKSNDLEVCCEDLAREIKIHVGPETVFLYCFDSNTGYQEYITLLAIHFKAVKELRNEGQTIFIENEYEYNESYRKEQKKLREQFPIIIIEKFE